VGQPPEREEIDVGGRGRRFSAPLRGAERRGTEGDGESGGVTTGYHMDPRWGRGNIDRNGAGFPGRLSPFRRAGGEEA